MTRRGFMGRLAAAAGVAAILPGVKSTIPGDSWRLLKDGDSLVANVHIGANQVARMEDTFVTIRDLHPIKWDNVIAFDFSKKCDENGDIETDAAYVKRYKVFLEDIEYQKSVTGSARFKIVGRKA